MFLQNIFLASVLGFFSVLSGVARAQEGFELSSLNLPQAYYFDGKSQEGFGHLVGLQAGDVQLQQDVQAVHPLTKSKVSIVGGISSFRWTGKSEDPIILQFQVSASNQKRLLGYIQEAKNTDFRLNFQLFAKDPESKEFVIRLKTFAYPFRGVMNRIGAEMAENKSRSMPVFGILKRANGQLPIEVSTTAAKEVLSPQNFTVKLTLQPLSEKRRELPTQTLIKVRGSEQQEKLSWGP